MSVWKLVKLNFGNCPAHFGELGIGLEETSERVRSDTLFSAWAIAYARLHKPSALTDLLTNFKSADELPFRLSSTFIYQKQNGNDIYYLPRPAKLPGNYSLGDDLSSSKDFKKLSFLPLNIWQKWYQTGGFDKDDIKELKGKYSEAFKFETHPKISVDRATSAANLYHIKFVRYQPSCGLYFLIYFPQKNEKLEHDLQAALELLGDDGIGGERSSGAGRFEPKWHNLSEDWQSLLEFEEGNYHSLISLYWEEKLKDNFLDRASYELQERGGWISSPFSGKQQRRKTVQMFLEGSTFTTQPQGKLADVMPIGAEHPVYRSGIALSIQIKAHQETK